MDVRPLLVAGFGQLFLAALVGLSLAAPSGTFPMGTDLILAAGGLALVGASLPLALRSPRAPVLAWAGVAAVGVADALAVVLPLAHLDASTLAARAVGVACLLLAACLALTRPPNVDLFSETQPFARGDRAVLALGATGLAFLALGGALLVWLPRGIPSAGLCAILAGAALPLLVGALLFVAPREAKRPLEGTTLVYAGLAVHALAILTLVAGFLLPVGTDFRWPSAAVLLAFVLTGAAAWRTKLPAMRALAAVALLAGLAVTLASAGGTPGTLLPVAGYALAFLGVALAVRATGLAGRLLGGQSVAPRGVSAGILAAGLLLLAPSFQYPRAAFPGALVAFLGLVVGLVSMRPALRRPTRPSSGRGRRA